MEKWLIPGLGQGKYKMSLGHLFVPEKRACQKDKGASLREFSLAKSGILEYQKI